jgi:hypothetical protein
MSFYPASKPHVPTTCNSCQYEFRQDPVFEVECPDCHAKAGQYCKRPSGHQGPLVPFHTARDIEALKLGFYDHPTKDGCGPTSSSERGRELVAKYCKGSVAVTVALFVLSHI